MGDLLRRAVSVKKKNKTTSSSRKKTMPSPATFTRTAAAVTDRQTAAAVNSISNNNNNSSSMAEARTTSHSCNRSRFSSISSKATSSEDNLFSSSFESNTSSFLDAGDEERLDEATIQIFYDSCGESSPSPPPPTPTSTRTAKAGKEKRTMAENQKVEIVVDEDLSASDLSDHLTIKLSLKGKHHLTAQIPCLNIQRDIQDDEEVLPLVASGHSSASRSCVCGNDSAVSPSGKVCLKHRRSSASRHVNDKSNPIQTLNPVKTETGTPKTEALEQSVKQSESQETVREMPEVRIILKKSSPCKYAFMERPQDFLCLHMVHFNLGSDQATGCGKVATDTSSKVLLMQELIRFGRETVPLTVRGRLTYNGRLVEAEINLTGRNFQDFFLLKCNKVSGGVDCESDALFLSTLYDVYTPIDDDDDGVAALSSEKSPRQSGKLRFALCRTGDSENEPVHWFSCESEEERTCWLTSMQMVKWGMKNLRQKAKIHAKLFPLDFDIVPPASYNDMSQQSVYAAMESNNETSSLKGEPSRRSRDETVSLMLKKHSPEYEPWFYPDMGREEATTSLSKYSSVDGVFLVRASQRTLGTFVLSFIASGKVNHVTIQNVDADHGQVVVSLDWGVTKFYDLKQLIEFYQLNQGSLPTRLTHFLVHK